MKTITLLFLMINGALALAWGADAPPASVPVTNDLRPLLAQVLRADDTLKVVISRQQENRLFGWVNQVPRTNMPVDLTVEITTSKTQPDAIAELARFKRISHVAPTKSISGLGDEAVLYSGADGKQDTLVMRTGTNTLRIAGKPALVNSVAQSAARELSSHGGK